MGKGIVGIIKFVLGVVLIPFVVAATMSFRGQLDGMGKLYGSFAWGLGTYIVFHLFVFTPQAMHHAGQKVLSEIFKFSEGLSKTMPLLIPLLSALLLILFYICSTFMKTASWQGAVMFWVGFTLAMHMVLCAQDVYEEDTNVLKPRYLFTMNMVYLVNLAIIAALIDLNFVKFSCPDFILQSWETGLKSFRYLGDKLLP